MPPHDDTLHPKPMTDDERSALLRELDLARPAPRGSRERRRSRRLPFADTEILVNIGHDGGRKSDLVITARNISATGLAFLHVGEIIVGRPCAVVIPSLEGTLMRVEGSVVRNRLVTDAIHEIGVEFDGEIDLSRVVPRLGFDRA